MKAKSRSAKSKSAKSRARLVPTLLAALVGLCLAPRAGLAQSATCEALQAQLAAFDHSGGARAAAFENAAQRQIDEMQRTAAYMRQIGCGNAHLPIFGSATPPQCGELSARLGRMQANLVDLRARADQLGGGQSAAMHRYQLETAIREYCGEAQRRAVGNVPADEDADAGDPSMQDDRTGADGQGQGADQTAGSGKPVCVRLCDGYYFPLSTTGRDGPDGAQAMCQAQCPGAETETFTLGSGDDIKQATGPGGKSYMELDNALRYQKAVVPNCSCRPAGKSWGETLKGAEDMLDRNPSDVVVDANKAAQMSRPAPRKGQGAAGRPGSATPSAGIATGNAGTPADGSVAAASQPEGAQKPAMQGAPRNVRIIAPPPSSTQP